MKKITMLFAALLACVGVMKADVTDLPQITEDLENPIYYTIYNTRSEQPGGLMYYAGDAVGLKDGCTSLTLEDKYKFFFTGSHDAMYIHNAATGNKLASVSSWTAEGTEWAMGVSPKGGGLAIGPKGGLSGNGCINEKNYSTNETTSDFTTWSANDDGSIFVVELAENYVFPMTDMFYIIECPLFEKVQGVKKGLYVKEDGTAAWTTVDLTNNNFYWIPTVNEDGTVALKNFGTDTYLSNTDGTMSAEAFNASLKALGDNSFNINLNATLHANGHGGGASAEGGLTNWGGAAGSASAWRFVQKSDPTALQEVVVKYSFTYGGEEKLTQEATTLVGEEWPVITASLPFGVSAAKPEGTVTAEGAVDGVVTKEIALSVELPFEYVASYAEVSDWYYMTIHANTPTYLYYDAEATALDATKKKVDATSKDAYSWAFVGNPFDGFSIVNKLAGNGKVLTSAEPASDETFPIVADGTQVWDFKTSSYGTNGFFIAYDGTNKRLNRQNKDGDKVCYWLDGADAGSTFMVELRDDAADLQAQVDEANGILTSLVEGTTVGYVTADSKTAISNAIAAAETAITNKTGYDEAQTNLQAAIDGIETIQPEEGKYYTIVSATEDARNGQMMYVNHSGNMHFCPEYNDSTLFQFVSAGEGKFYLYNAVGKSYLSTAKGHGGGQEESKAATTEEAKAVTISNLYKANVVKIVPEGGAMMHAQSSGASIVGWNAAENVEVSASAWTIVEVDIAELTQIKVTAENGETWADLTEVNATLQLTAAVTPNVGTDYTITWSSDAEELISISETGLVTLLDYCPTYRLVTITATMDNGKKATFDLNVMTEAAPGAVTEIVLVGPASGELIGPKGTTCQIEAMVFPETAADKTLTWTYSCSWCECISVDQNGLVTIISDNTEDGGMVTITATASNGVSATCYLAVTIEKGNIDTAIESVEAESETVIYDLLGRRVEKMEKGGIYIVNGKKVIK